MAVVITEGNVHALDVLKDTEKTLVLLDTVTMLRYTVRKAELPVKVLDSRTTNPTIIALSKELGIARWNMLIGGIVRQLTADLERCTQYIIREV